jgi:hypothetical protein
MLVSVSSNKRIDTQPYKLCMLLLCARSQLEENEQGDESSPALWDEEWRPESGSKRGAHLQGAARRQLARAVHAQRLASRLYLVALPITQQVSEKVLCSEGACNACRRLQYLNALTMLVVQHRVCATASSLTMIMCVITCLSAITHSETEDARSGATNE